MRRSTSLRTAAASRREGYAPKAYRAFRKWISAGRRFRRLLQLTPGKPNVLLARGRLGNTNARLDDCRAWK